MYRINHFFKDKMERSSIFVKTLMLYEAQKKDLTIFEEMKWLVIHSKICDVLS